MIFYNVEVLIISSLVGKGVIKKGLSFVEKWEGFGFKRSFGSRRR